MPRVLIVDDEPGIRKLLSVAFTKAGYEVRAAENGHEAIRYCTAEHFDAVLSDVRMPGMNGHELRQWIARSCPQMEAVLMSGFDDLQCANCGFAHTPCTFLSKPFLPKQAVETIERLLNGRQLAESDPCRATDSL
jgi:DNA-binding NtrC family response regulator